MYLHVVGVHVVLGRALHPARAGGVELLLVTPGHGFTTR